LKYVHDITTGEFFTAGTVMFSPDGRFLRFRFRKNLGLLSDSLPHVSSKHFRLLMKTIGERGRNFEKHFQGLELFVQKGFQSILTEFLPKDDSALQWSSIQSGVTGNLDATFDRLYEALAGKYDRRGPAQGRSDEDVWRQFSKLLESRELVGCLSEKAIEGRNDRLVFPFAWKNGVWHCFETMSFDLKSADGIKEKAHRRAGELVGVIDAKDQFKVYLIVAKPEDRELHEAYERALGILGNTPVNKEIVTEEQQLAFADRLKEQIQQHGSSPC
jgi:hypothetical protein